MFTKMMMLFTALPLTLALCSDANAVGSKAAQARKSICADIKNIKDKNDPRLRLKPFCDGTTLHCTTHARGGIGLLGKIEGVCDHPRLCTDMFLYNTCKEQCLDARTDQHGINDEKSKKIKAALDKCPIGITPPTQTKPLVQRPTSALPTYIAPPTDLPPEYIPPPPTDLPPEYIPPPPTDLPPELNQPSGSDSG
jgi:hypothetical protein